LCARRGRGAIAAISCCHPGAACTDQHWLFADLFAILKTTEKLERAWTQDAISAADYELACTKLIAQFKTLWGTLRDTVSAVAADARPFGLRGGQQVVTTRVVLHIVSGQLQRQGCHPLHAD